MNKRVVSLTLFVSLMAFSALASAKVHQAHKNAAHHTNLRKLSPQNQFHFAPTRGPAKAFLDHARPMAVRRQAPNLLRSGVTPLVPRSAPRKAARRPRRNGTSQPILPGFLTATQIPTGGYIAGQNGGSLAGDFDGDGNLDVVTVVGDPSNTGNYYFSVVRSNGDGSFQAPVWTATPNNSADPFVVGDVDGDGLDDLIVAHQSGGPNAAPGIIISSSANFDVLLSNGDGTFTLDGNYAITDNSLAGGILYDVDGDGNLDAVLIDSATPAHVYTLLGNGDGTFQPPTAASLNVQVGYDVVFADLNGDGWLDITANDGNTRQQTVFLATATAATAFAAGVVYTTPDENYNGCSTTVGDITGDGFPEIVSANCFDGNITIYVNNGDGSYQQGVYYNAALSSTGGSVPVIDPDSVAIADVNRDGINDVLSSNNYSGDVTVLISNGDGTVNVPTQGYATGGYPLSSAIVADLDGDGLADLIMPDDLFSLTYMKGYGDGTFRSAVNYYTPTTDNGQVNGYDIATGDFNNDGFPDVVIGNCCNNTVGITVFLSRPDGTLQPGVNYGSGGSLQYVAVGDFDGDGHLDIAASDSGNNVVQIFHGATDGSGTFTTGNTYATDIGEGGPQAIVVADFDGDGTPDIAVTNYYGSNVGVLLNNGTGGFQSVSNYATCSGTQQITAADVNGDGYPDLLTPLPSCTGMAVFLNNGDGSGTFQPENDFGIGKNPFQVAVGDLDGDGNVDLVISMDSYDSVSGAPVQGLAVAKGNGDGTFQAVNIPAFPSTLQPNTYAPLPTYVKLVDLDGDGNLDAVYTNTEFGTVGVMYGVGNGTFFDPVEYPTGGFSYALALADVNNDGATDVVTATYQASAVSVLLNNAGSGAVPDYTITVAPPTDTISAGASATFTFTVTPHNFYNGTITFACTGLPAQATCTFNPTSITPNGNGALTSTLTIHTTAASASLQVPAGPNQTAPSLWASLSGLGVFGLMLAGDWKKKRNRRLGIILGLVVLGLMFMLVGCGGSSSNGGGGGGGGGNAGTPAGTYAIQVTATGTAGSNGGNTAGHVASVSVVVQ